MDFRIDLGAGPIVGRHHQGVLWRSRVLLSDSLDPCGGVLHFMDAALPLQPTDRFFDLASGELLDHGLQLRIALSDDLVQLDRPHRGAVRAMLPAE